MIFKGLFLQCIQLYKVKVKIGKKMPLFDNQLLLQKLKNSYQVTKKCHKESQDLLILKLIPNWLQLITFLLLLSMTNSQCSTFYGNSVSKSCTICLNNGEFMNCSYNYNLTTVPNLNQSSCSNYCCSFDITNSITFCNNNNQSSSSTTDAGNSGNIKLATIMVILFFSIFGCLCFIVIFITCYRRNNSRTFLIDVRTVHLSGTNLANFNIDEIGPLYLDSKQTCSICLQQKCNIRTNCGHKYHNQCLYDWIQRKQNCPLCVSKDFNPIVVYCNKCFRSIKLVVLMQKMDDHVQQSWKNLDAIICQVCLGFRNNPYDISIDLSSQIMNKRIDAGKGDQLDPTGKVQSNRCITL